MKSSALARDDRMRRYRGFSGISVLNGMLPASRANGAFTLDSSRRLKRHSNFPHIRRWTTGGGGRTTASDNGRDEHRSLSGVGCGVNTGGGQEWAVLKNDKER